MAAFRVQRVARDKNCRLVIQVAIGTMLFAQKAPMFVPKRSMAPLVRRRPKAAERLVRRVVLVLLQFRHAWLRVVGVTLSIVRERLLATLVGNHHPVQTAQLDVTELRFKNVAPELGAISFATVLA